MVLCHAGELDPALYYRNTYIFKPETNHFTKLDEHPAMAGRSRHAVTYVEQEDQLYMFGGFVFDLPPYIDDLWVMDTTAILGKISRS